MSSFPTLEEAKAHAYSESKRERRRRSSAANWPLVPKDNEAGGQANRDKELVRPLQEDPVQEAEGETVKNGQAHGNSPDKAEANTQKEEERDKPSVITQLMSKLVSQDGDNNGSVASSTTVAEGGPSTAHAHPPHTESQPSSNDISQLTPDTITYYRPKPKMPGIVPDSAPLLSTTGEPFPSNTPQVSFATPQPRPSRLANSLPPPPRSELFEASTCSTDNYREFSNDSQFEPSEPASEPPSAQDTMSSRQNANIEGILMGGPSLSPTRQGTFATRANPEIVQPHRMIPSMHGVVGNTGLSNIPGTPNFSNMPLTASQAEQQQRIAAIWRDSNNAVPYSPSIYDAPGQGDQGRAGQGVNLPHPAQPVPTASAAFTPNPLAPPHIPAGHNDDVQMHGNNNVNATQGGGPASLPPRPPTTMMPSHPQFPAPFNPQGAQNSNQHSGFASPVDHGNNNGHPHHPSSNGPCTPLAHDQAGMNNLMSFLTEKILYHIGASRDSILDHLLRRTDMLYSEVQQLRIDGRNQTELIDQLVSRVDGYHESVQAGHNRMEERLTRTLAHTSELRDDVSAYRGENHGGANGSVERQQDTAAESEATVPTPTAAFRTPEGRTGVSENSESANRTEARGNNVVGGINTGSPGLAARANAGMTNVDGGLPLRDRRAPIPQYNAANSNQRRPAGGSNDTQNTGTAPAHNAGGTTPAEPTSLPPRPIRAPASFYPRSTMEAAAATAATADRTPPAPVHAVTTASPDNSRTAPGSAARQHQPAIPNIGGAGAGRGHSSPVRRGRAGSSVPAAGTSTGGCPPTFSPPDSSGGQGGSSQVTGTTWGGTSNWYRRAYPAGRGEE